MLTAHKELRIALRDLVRRHSEIEIDKMLEHSVRGCGGANASSWVVDMEVLLQADPSVEMARSKQRSIYRVPEFIKKMTNCDAYRPQFVSLGPYHHGEPHLLAMEEHKRRALVHLVKRAKKPLVEFVVAIEEVVDELQAANGDLDDKWRGANRGRFVEMMVTDGCFLLELIRMASILRKDVIDNDYAADDPTYSKRSFSILWSTMHNDMIAMENQLPLVVLKRLLGVQLGTSPSASGVNYCVSLLLDCGHLELEEGMENNLGLHFLDIYHKSYCGTRTPWQRPESDQYERRTPCAVELSEAGIKFEKSVTDNIHDIDFQNGVLRMPQFGFGDETEMELLNLMAFEWLHPEAKDDVRTYISFVDKIIESEKDVALLRSKGMFLNMSGSDKKAVKMFNTLTNLAGSSGDKDRLGHVQWKVNAHCKKRRNKWRSNFVNTYLSNPWVFISPVAAMVLLVATLLQTIYTIVPFYTKG